MPYTCICMGLKTYIHNTPGSRSLRLVSLVRSLGSVVVVRSFSACSLGFVRAFACSRSLRFVSLVCLLGLVCPFPHCRPLRFVPLARSLVSLVPPRPFSVSSLGLVGAFAWFRRRR